MTKQPAEVYKDIPALLGAAPSAPAPFFSELVKRGGAWAGPGGPRGPRAPGAHRLSSPGVWERSLWTQEGMTES